MKQLISFVLTFFLCRLSLSLVAQPLKIHAPTISLDVDALRAQLSGARMEGELLSGTPVSTVQLPLPGGELRQFTVEESPVLGRNLSAQYPEIKTYRINGQEADIRQGRLLVSPYGIQAIIATSSGWMYIEPAEDANYQVYYGNSQHQVHALAEEMLFKPDYVPVVATKNKVSIGEDLFIFNMAMLADGEYAEARTTGTPVLGAVIAAMAADVNSINAIFETDLSIRFVLQEAYAYLNKSTDPFPIADLGPGREAMVAIGELIDEGIFHPENFDLGHLVSGRNIGGSAFVGVVGDDQVIDIDGDLELDAPFKAGGGIGTPDPQGSHWVGQLCHEIGHMFGALHTFNGADGTCGRPGQYDSEYAYEPGSGSTIMSYAGRCSDDDVSQTLDNYFHIASVEAIHQFLQQDRIQACMEQQPTGNTPPRVFANPLGQHYMIPKGTPFYLTGEAADLEEDELTYCWEQYDLGTQGLLEESPFDISDREGENGAPLFRSFAPNPSITRTFPRWPAILGNATDKGELLPQQSRTMTFRLTVRDNHAGGGGLGSDEVQVEVDGNSGPFVITSFNEPTTWTGLPGDPMTVEWDVAKTDQSPIHCERVNILFSANDGESFPIVLGEEVPNTGSFTFAMPEVFTSSGRILIQAANNIFFDVNDASIKIGGECYAEGSTISPTDDLSAEWGTDDLLLDLAPDYGTPLEEIALSFTPLTPKANLTTSNSGSCFSFTYPTAFFTQNFQVNKDGEYVFQLPEVDHTTYYLANLYEAPYEPADPCFNWMASSSHFISGSVSVTNEMKVDLEARKEYVLVTFALTFGDYRVQIQGPSGGNAYVGMVPPNDDFIYTYVVFDQVSGKIVGFEQEADLRGIIPGDYHVYGFSFPAGFSLDAFIGLDKAAFEEKMLTVGFCGDLSENFKAVTITGTNTLLPVELLEFQVFADPPNGVRLDWTTTVEENNAHFLVERSADGRKFTVIGQVKGAGNSFVEQKYRFEDSRPLPGLNYYRLAQVDYDGTVHRYEVASAMYEQKSQMQVYPNPVATGPIYVEYKLAQSGPVTVEWINASGQVLSREVKEMPAGYHRMQMSIDALPAGLYNLRLSSLTDQHNFKMSKQ